MSPEEYLFGLSDDDVLNQARTFAVTWADACRELHRRLVEAREDVERERNRANANRDIMLGEQGAITRALGHLETIYNVVHEADEEFNFTGNYDPDGAPDAPEHGPR